MKVNNLISSIILCSLLLNFNLNADTTPPVPFVVNPDTIKTQLLTQNISLLQSLNNVEASKLNVNMARAKLFPTINLGVLLPALANPTFLLGSVTFLFPFLVPSNWAVMKQEQNLFEADKAAYNSLQLNILSSAYSLYYTYLNDTNLQNIYFAEASTLEKIYNSLKRQSDEIGNVTIEDLEMSHANMNLALVSASKIQELVIAEKASLRTILGLPLGTELNIQIQYVPNSKFEDKSIQEVFDRSMEVAPEVTQLNFLVKAAQNGKFAKSMAFISQSSIGGSANNSGNAFKNLKIGDSFSFGLDNVVSIQLAENNIDSIKLRQDSLKLENEKTAEILVGQLTEMKNQFQLTNEILNNRLEVYRGQKRQYLEGLISLQTLLQTEAQLTDIKISMSKSTLDYNLQKLALQRLVIDGNFSNVKGCNGSSLKDDKFHLFGIGKKKSQSLDEVCRQ